MPNGADNGTRRRWPWAAMLLLFAMYVLSIGPIVWLQKNGYLSINSYIAILGTVYLPVLWLYGSKPLGRVLDWYLSLWVG